MNVHHASLFPDLIGASEYCNILTAEAEQAAEIARQATSAATAASATPVAAPQESGPEAPAAATASTQSIEDVLREPPEAQQVEPGRIALIALEISKVIAENKVVDWEKRESVQAYMRNRIKVELRKLGYPMSLRDGVTERILALIKRAPPGA